MYEEFEKRFPDSKDNKGSQMVQARKEGWREALVMVKHGIFEHRNALEIIEDELGV